MAWTAVVLTNLLIIRGDSVTLAVFANLIVYTTITFGLSFLLKYFNKIRYPIGSILGGLPVLFLAFYVYVTFDSYIQTSVIPSVSGTMVIGIVGIIPILVAILVLLVYFVYGCPEMNKEVEDGSKTSK